MAAGASKLTKAYQTPNAMLPMRRGQTARDKLGSREGDSPELQLRAQSACEVEKGVGRPRQLGGWLGSRHTVKECVIAH